MKFTTPSKKINNPDNWDINKSINYLWGFLDTHSQRVAFMNILEHLGIESDEPAYLNCKESMGHIDEANAQRRQILRASAEAENKRLARDVAFPWSEEDDYLIALNDALGLGYGYRYDKPYDGKGFTMWQIEAAAKLCRASRDERNANNEAHSRQQNPDWLAQVCEEYFGFDATKLYQTHEEWEKEVGIVQRPDSPTDEMYWNG